MLPPACNILVQPIAPLSRRAFLKLAGTAALASVANGCQFPVREASNRPELSKDKATMWQNVSDYTFMWWADGFRHPQRVYNIQTSRFGLSFDAGNFNLRKLGAFPKPISEVEALTKANGPIESLADVSLEAVLEVEGHRFKAAGAVNDSEHQQLIESGKFFQRRWQNYPVFEPGAPELDAAGSGLEISAWPDRAAFTLRLIPLQAIPQAMLEISLQLPPEYATQLTGGEGIALVETAGGGFVFWKQAAEAGLGVEAGKITARLPVSAWLQGEERWVGLIVYPAMDARQALAMAEAAESKPLRIEARQILPADHDLEVAYDPQAGWYTIRLRNDGEITDYADASNHRFEQVALSIPNPSGAPRIVRLNFAKDGQVFGITGMSAILRDNDHYPTGIPIQLSKNWHNSDPKSPQRKRFEGPWFHGITMLTVPPGETLSLEYVGVNAMWGTLPAASHAQLCLVGWGSHQLWDQAAIGSWGESLCFEPDQGQVGGAVLDTRPLMVWGMGQEPHKKWGWTNNVGGADFLVYYDKNVEKQWNSRMKTMYRRNGPNLTEVTYAGTSYDRKIDLEYTVSLYRTDDIVRGVYHFRYAARERVEFSKLVLFQCGGNDYSYTGERKFAYGNETGLVKEWETQWGGFTYRTGRMELAGKIPWVSMHEAVSRDAGFGAWANRGIVVRGWDARLGGKKAAPWIAEIGAQVRGSDTSLVDFLPPPGVNELLPGDYVEAEVVHVIVPQFAADYYGPNENLRQALAAGENTWKMIYREAVGNDLDVKVTRGGKLERSYPIQIRSQGGEIAFTVTGGLGYVPATFTGLIDYRGHRLEQKVEGAWVELDQSHYGKDFWQADFNPLDERWELTYNLPLDTPHDERLRQDFRLV